MKQRSGVASATAVVSRAGRAWRLPYAALDRLEAFAAHFGADFYRLPRNTDTITLRREPWQVPATLPLGSSHLTPMRAGGQVAWRVVDEGA